MFKLFGIPNCDTVKKARTFLEKKKIDFEFVDFKKCAPTSDDIKRWEESFGGLPVNAKGQTYKKHKDNYERLKKPEQVKFLTQNSSMIKRPILEKNGKVLAFGFDEENYKTILK
jgi:Spx/MgsR family transcriptional regulator